jgi:hypothetical protein
VRVLDQPTKVPPIARFRTETSAGDGEPTVLAVRLLERLLPIQKAPMTAEPILGHEFLAVPLLPVADAEPNPSLAVSESGFPLVSVYTRRRSRPGPPLGPLLALPVPGAVSIIYVSGV